MRSGRRTTRSARDYSLRRPRLARAGALLLGLTLSSFAMADALDQWTPRAAPQDAPAIFNNAVYGGGKFVAVSDLGKVIYSLDGLNWSTAQTPTQQFLISVAYGNGRYVAVGERLTMLHSTDAKTWTKLSETNNDEKYFEVVFAGGEFIAVGSTGRVRSSVDGLVWTNMNIPEPTFYVRSVTKAKGLYVAVGEDVNYVPAIYTSPTGSQWTKRAPHVTGELVGIAYGANRFVVVGESGSLTTSEDGITWTARAGLKNTYFWNVVYAHNLFVATGDASSLYTSPDGITWTPRNAGVNASFDGVAFNGDTFVIVGDNRAIIQSASVNVQEPPTPPGDPAASRLGNLSTRAFVGTGSEMMVSGFVLSGTAPQKLLIRGVGPSLTPLGVNGALANPQLKIFNSAGHEVAANDDWSVGPGAAEIAQVSGQVGAFALQANSKDAALVASLTPGAYTVQISGVTNTTGIALAEVYPVQAAANTRLVNLSSRTWVGTGAEQSIAGFVISGTQPRQLLIRAVGPSLAQFGINNALPNPRLNLVNAQQQSIATNDDWQNSPNAAAIAQAATKSGAFALGAGSKDSCILVTLQPGLYTALVSDVADAKGIALVEVYEVQ